MDFDGDPSHCSNMPNLNNKFNKKKSFKGIISIYVQRHERERERE